jgi:regulator of sigma E protease
VKADDLHANAPVGETKNLKGLGVELGYDEMHPILGDVIKDSPAAVAGMAPGDQITSIEGKPVKSWFDIHRALLDVSPGGVAQISYNRAGAERQTTLKVDAAQAAAIRGVRYYINPGLLAPYNIVRKAPNPLVAINWGVMETRDFILQFYVTLQRMFGGSIGLSNMMGPYGILRSGVSFSYKGYDWLLWFLAMISANLAVVNFLPIPVVDGGQFVFLILEKIKGKPISPRAMAIAQYAGLAFLAAVVVFVTYHDIMRRY